MGVMLRWACLLILALVSAACSLEVSFDPPAASDAAPADAAPLMPDAAQVLFQPDATLPCSGAQEAYDAVTGHCYFRVQPSQTWAQARDFCVSQGAHLATVGSAAEQALVQSLDDGTIAECWIGASDATSEGDWRWLDNVDFPPSPAPNASGYQYWRSGEPNNNGGEDCAIVQLYLGGAWDDRNCGTTMSSICERDGS
jgi:hypothetical protein